MKKTALIAILLAFLTTPLATFAQNDTKPAVPTEKVEQKPAKLPTLDDIMANFIATTAKVGDKIGDAAAQVGDFAVKEIPLVLKEYLTWHWVESFFWSIIIGGGIMAMGLTLFKKVIWNNFDKEWANSRGDMTELGVGVGFAIAGTIILMFIGCMTTAHNLDWVKISLAPRVYLIDQAATFMKK